MARVSRRRISTTIAPENAAFLRSMMKRGKAATLAEALDRAISVARCAEARERLEVATEAYFASLSPEALEEENRLGAALGDSASHVDLSE